MAKILLAAAAALTVIRLAVPFIPVYGVTLGQAHELCSSWVGTLAQSYDAGSAANCSRVALAYDGLNLVTAAIAGCLIAAVLLAIRRGVTR